MRRYATAVVLALPVLVMLAESGTEIAVNRRAIGLELRLRALNRGLIGLNCAGVAGNLIAVELGERCHQVRLIRLQQALCILVQFAEIAMRLHSRQLDGGAVCFRRSGVAGVLVRFELRECIVQIGAILLNRGTIGLDCGG